MKKVHLKLVKIQFFCRILLLNLKQKKFIAAEFSRLILVKSNKMEQKQNTATNF